MDKKLHELDLTPDGITVSGGEKKTFAQRRLYWKLASNQSAVKRAGVNAIAAGEKSAPNRQRAATPIAGAWPESRPGRTAAGRAQKSKRWCTVLRQVKHVTVERSRRPWMAG